MPSERLDGLLIAGLIAVLASAPWVGCASDHDRTHGDVAQTGPIDDATETNIAPIHSADAGDEDAGANEH